MQDVVLIGGNHHNGLGLARSFGRCGIKPYGIIVNDCKKSFVTKSKYWKKTWILSSEDDIVEFVLENFKEGTVIIPYSDRVAMIIDVSLDILQTKFIVPSIANKEGRMYELQDKYAQIQFANKHSIPTPQSQIVKIPFDSMQYDDIIFPCILKPVTSAEGDKRDIVKCDDSTSLKAEISRLCQKGYERVLVQEFVDYDYEFVVFGSCGRNESYLIKKNIRQWPEVGGTASFAQCLVDDLVCSSCENILKALKEENFNGLFDIELFKVGNRVLLNEINWRNSGACFLCKGTGVEYAVIWYLEMTGQQEKADSMKHFCNDPAQYQMNEATDLRHVVYGSMSFKKWINDLKKCQSMALWNTNDFKPTIYQYFHLIFEMIKRVKC